MKGQGKIFTMSHTDRTICIYYHTDVDFAVILAEFFVTTHRNRPVCTLERAVGSSRFFCKCKSCLSVRSLWSVAAGSACLHRKSPFIRLGVRKTMVDQAQNIKVRSLGVLSYCKKGETTMRTYGRM